MIDSFWISLSSASVSLLAVAMTLAKYRDFKRREADFIEKEARLPEAVRYPAVSEEVARLEAQRIELEPLVAEAKAKSEYAKQIQNWLNLNLGRYEKATHELPALKAEIEQRTAERDAILNEASEIQDQYAAAQKDYAALLKEIAGIELQLERKKLAEAWLLKNFAIYEAAKEELPRLKQEVAAAQKEHQSLIESQEDVRMQIEELHRRHASILAEMAPAELVMAKRREAEAWLQKNYATYETAKETLPGIEHDIAEANDELQELISERDDIQTRITELHRQHAELLNELAPARSMIEQRQEAEAWLADNRGLYDTARGELPVLRNAVEATRDAHDELLMKLDATREEHGKLIGTIAELKVQYDGVRQELDRLRTQCSGTEAERQRLAHEIAELQARQAGLLVETEQTRVERDSVIAALERERVALNDVRRELSKRREELTELETERATKLEVAQMLDRLVKKLEADKKQLEDELERTKARLQTELDQINSLIAAAVKRWGDVGPTVGADDRNRLAELWQPVLMKTDFKTPFKPSRDGGEVEALDRTSQHLQNIGLRFGKRVLNAFHTSLKVAEMSPLVVLAGISGTGKSELPRRYAEGMGMHALTLAVQPRWDSPQDMFGFYNYLESRYRATELARALVQMDRFAKERKADWNYPDEWLKDCLSDRMLLVLLDEMNLARVEYYFSEFLSKLETRRGIQRNVPGERRKAEVMLEVGLQSLRREDGNVIVTQQPTLPLFVDRNVLFVGTMNEDESTQTLSDKVVDRANVLRFGKPQKLGAEAAASNGKPTDSYLPYAIWEKWIADEDKLKSSVRDEFNSWVHELNQAMQDIGRPFAHRTYGAMLSYIANYPEPDQYKFAMADQIELKLLPKFRGLDPSDSKVRGALGTVQKLVEQMGDAKLLQALRDASKQSEHQFVWHGVDRTDES